MIDDFKDMSVLLRGGVYVLLHGGVVVYVGKTKLLGKRLYEHHSNRFKRRGPKLVHSKIVYGSQRSFTYDGILVKPCALSEVDELERELIEHYKPKYNIQLKPLITAEFSERYLNTGIVAQILAKRNLPPPPPRRVPLIDRRGL